MKHALLIPDSFKGTMSSIEICDILAESIARYHPGAAVTRIPVADGGEGSVDCFLEALGGEKVTVTVSGPLFEELASFYGLLDGGNTAVVEMAAAAGLPQVEGRADPRRTTTHGVGQLLLHAVRRGAKKLIVGLGGSATNDGGCGAAAAAGVRFLRENGEEFVPVGGTLRDIARIDVSGLDPAIRQAEIIAMCDVDNPLTGPHGAAHIFAPQKGADEATVRELDDGLRHLAERLRQDVGIDVESTPGSGAAGGLGAGMLAFFGANMQMGIETVLDTVRFDELVRKCDVVFTGEGRIDNQSLRGKVVVGVARRAKAAGVPVVAVVGDIGDDIEPVYDLGVSAIFSTNRVAVPWQQAKARAVSDFKLTADNLMRASLLLR